jgi:peptidoglycan-associated lipoprotein
MRQCFPCEPNEDDKMMKTMHSIVVASAVVAALALGGCASSVRLDDKAPVETRTPTPTTGAGTGNAGNAGAAAPQTKVVPVDLGNTQAGAARLDRVVYFDFDSFAVREEFRGLIEGHAKLLAADRKRRMTIEGHTDERGSREYNLALGQKRAEAVARSLTLLGVADAQLESVSFGEERPAVEGHDEAAWAKNRRAELVSR